jgi:hypothetical protein
MFCSASDARQKQPNAYHEALLCNNGEGWLHFDMFIWPVLDVPRIMVWGINWYPYIMRLGLTMQLVPPGFSQFSSTGEINRSY